MKQRKWRRKAETRRKEIRMRGNRGKIGGGDFYPIFHLKLNQELS